MSRILLKVTAGLIAVLLLILAIVAVVFPRWVESEDFQATLRAAATKALGAPIEWQSMDAGVLPPRLMIQNPVLSAGPGMPGESRLAASSLELRLAILPIFLSRIEIASLVVRGAEVTVTRTAEGFLLPPMLMSSTGSTASEDETDGTANSDNADSAANSDEADNAGNAGNADNIADPDLADEGSTFAAGPFGLAIDRVAVSNSRIVVHDRTVSPPIEWRIEGFELKAGARIATGSLKLQMGATLQLGEEEVGRVDVTGNVDMNGSGDLAIKIDRLLVAPFSAYLEGIEASGSLSGRISITGTVSEITKVDLDVRLADVLVGTSGAGLGGRLRLDASRVDGQSIVCKAVLDLNRGGRIEVDGTSTLEGRLDLRSKIVSLDLAVLEALLPDSGMKLAGNATGKARLVGPAQSLDFIELDVHVNAGLLSVPNYEVEGPFDVDLRIDDPLSESPRGKLDADLTAATLEYQALFKKRAGIPADLKTTFSTNKSGQTEFESRIKFRNIDEILLHGVIGEATSVAMTVPRFDLDGWTEVFPALVPYEPVGFISFEEFGIESIKNSPNRFRGWIRFEEVDLAIPSVGRAQLRGSMVGRETKIQTKDLKLTFGGTTLGVTGEIQSPFQSRRFDLAIQSLGQSDANDFFGAMPLAAGTIQGDLQIAGNISGVLGGGVDIYSTLDGELALSVGKNGGGRLRGVSILQAVLDQFPILGGAARLFQPFRAGKSIDDYFTDEFEIIEGDFEIGEGKVNARTLRLVYEGYEAHLTGPVHLPSLEIDMTGEIYLKADLLSALGGLFGATVGDQKPVQIPLAHVTNTLAEPEIEMTAETLVAVPQLLFKASGLETLTLGVGRTISRSLGGREE